MLVQQQSLLHGFLDIQPKYKLLLGTTNENRLKDICTASNVVLSRQEWYDIYLAAGNELP